MTPQELKASILQLAIEGKLVEHYSQDKLLDEVKRNAVSPEGDNIPFDIPDTWCWCYLEDIATLYNGRAYKKPEMLADGKYPLLRVGNLFTSDTWYYSDLELEPEKYCDNGDLLYAWSASFGPHIWNGGKVIYHYHIWKVDLRYPQMRDYLYWVLAAQTESIKRRGHGSTMIHITKAGTEKMFIPVPPLAEQKRIVAKIEELLPLIDRYEQAWSKLEEFNKRFPVDMQKSILQTAIQGKLVPQLPEEGTSEELFQQIQAEKQTLIKAGKIKKEKPLPEITEAEIPFDIPESWAWVRLGTVIDMLSGFAFKSTDFKEIGRYRLLRGINLSVGNTRWDDTVYVDEMPDKCKSFQILKGDVLIGLDRPWISEGIRVAIYDDDEDTYLVQRVLRIRETAAITKEYIALLLRSNLFRNAVEGETTGISVPHISPGQVGSVAVPLPPLAEQKRIVAKLEEILPLCERLK